MRAKWMAFGCGVLLAQSAHGMEFVLGVGDGLLVNDPFSKTPRLWGILPAAPAAQRVGFIVLGERVAAASHPSSARMRREWIFRIFERGYIFGTAVTHWHAFW